MKVIAALLNMQVVFQRRGEEQLWRCRERIDLGLEAGQNHPEDRKEHQRSDDPRQGPEQQALQTA